MADDIFKWNRIISALNDEQLKQEIDLPPSKLLPELLPKSDVPKLILTLFAMELGLPWTTTRNKCTKRRRWLDSDEANTLSHTIIHQAHSGKELCRHIVN